ncbi:MerR family transcriptional regulator [Pandoraea sp.]|uniref:MerR family transcriptional regulator n=1 Tax=Pandoraea sp. TaxID=1883445 RepID=UPI001226E5DF|nr:MerR family transcriptional regulator [Pandoraea sp.]TAL54542.1 MAG: MerR family transcriptional regulator [Pandoraea sp.]TAM15758.1 MAG: MerR family transcriptional regulator [Pandoraea sp.]
MQKASGTMSIGALARAAGVHVETIRFYQLKGLLRTPARPAQGIRRYAGADVAGVRFIKAAQRLGFSLDEAGQLLRLDDGAHCGEAAALAEVRLADVRERLRDLRGVESVLSTLAQACHSARGKVSCPLISTLQQVDRPRGR